MKLELAGEFEEFFLGELGKDSGALAAILLAGLLCFLERGDCLVDCNESVLQSGLVNLLTILLGDLVSDDCGESTADTFFLCHDFYLVFGLFYAPLIVPEQLL